MRVVRVFVLPVSRYTGESGGGDSMWGRLIHLCECFSFQWRILLDRRTGESLKGKERGEQFLRFARSESRCRKLTEHLSNCL